MPTPESLDARIRTLVTELIDAAPPAPSLPQLEWGDQYHQLSGPNGGGNRPTRRRPGRFGVLVPTAVVLATVAGLATLVAVGPRSGQPVTSGHSHPVGAAGQPPAAVTGNEQTTQSKALPTFFTEEEASAGNCWDVTGRPEALSVEGGPTFVSWTASPATGPPCRALSPMAAVTYQGNGLVQNGTGTETFMGGATGTVAGTTTAVLVLEQWPVAGQTTYVWNGLPSDARYVTYTGQGTTLYWEVPRDGTAAFLVPEQFAQAPPTHGDPRPVLTAYDAAGDVLGTVNAPRVGMWGPGL